MCKYITQGTQLFISERLSQESRDLKEPIMADFQVCNVSHRQNKVRSTLFPILVTSCPLVCLGKGLAFREME